MGRHELAWRGGVFRREPRGRGAGEQCA
jgi:hypothetical protein